jgi:hypothetical protein
VSSFFFTLTRYADNQWRNQSILNPHCAALNSIASS